MEEPGSLRILSFNVNGLKACLQRTGRQFANLKGLLLELGADIVCVQETKLRRCELERDVAVLDGWDSFFCCSQSPRGYSGVATYVRSSLALPFAAEEGFTGCAVPTAGGGSGQAPQAPCPTLLQRFTVDELAELDSEGRVLITDHGAFVLFNIYGPAISSEETAAERLAFKLRFYEALEMRWRHYRQQGRAVVVVGDLNIAPASIDYPELDSEARFYRRPDRQWLRQLLHGPGGDGGGMFVDTFRAFHPQRKDAYTVWSTATNARVNNYGSRIDLVLVAGLALGGSRPSGQGPAAAALPQQPQRQHLQPHHQQPQQQQHLQQQQDLWAVSSIALPAAESSSCGSRSMWVAAADIWPELQGSDHCPVWVDLAYTGCFPCAAAAPPCAMRYLFGGKQLNLHAWLQPVGNPAAEALAGEVGLEGVSQQLLQTEPGDDVPSASHQPAMPQAPRQGSSNGAAAARQQGGRPGGKKQPLLKAFLQQRQQQQTRPPDQPEQQQQQQQVVALSTVPIAAAAEPAASAQPNPPSDFVAAELAAAAEAQQQQLQAAKGFWQKVQASQQVPICEHGEPAELKRVNKSGANHGRYFFVCKRPEGVGEEGQCSFFQWVQKRQGDHPLTTMGEDRPSGLGKRRKGG